MGEYELTLYQKALRDKWVTSQQYEIMGEKTTVCLLKLKNGFEVVGTSACVNPNDFVLETGKHFAMVDALSKLDGFIGFYRQMETNKNETGRGL